MGRWGWPGSTGALREAVSVSKMSFASFPQPHEEPATRKTSFGEFPSGRGWLLEAPVTPGIEP